MSVTMLWMHGPGNHLPQGDLEIIRGEIGFDGLLMSDDLSMEALEGDFAHRTDACFSAGCDMVLHCNGIMKEMEEIASVCRVLEGKALERAQCCDALYCTNRMKLMWMLCAASYREILEPMV